jgi:hypothetical protein
MGTESNPVVSRGCECARPQRSRQVRNNERGIALIIVLFATLLLTVIGLGMMYATNMETAINHNYRDSQVALYAALAGLQEARERIKYPYDITPPTQLPSTSAPNIIYIVSDASTVKPWDPTNAFFDTELCQEKVLGLTGSPGVPCTSTASGTAWYQVFDNSQSSAGPWNLANPLDWKWTRIQLKGNNNTPVPVNGDSTDASQSCWNGRTQMSTPTSYTTGCQPIGGVTSISLDSHGTDYTSAPTVTLTGGGGTGATATAVLGNETTGVVSSVAVDLGGAGYVTPPTVTFSSGAATATAVLSSTGTSVTSGTVTSAAVGSGGSGYLTPPTVTFSGGGGSGATGTAVLSTTGVVTTSGYVNALNVTAGGSGYTSPPTVDISGFGGGASGTATLGTTGTVKSIALSSAGTQCYSAASDAVVTFSGGGGSGAAASAVLEANRSCIYSVAVTSSPQCSAKLNAANGYSPIDQKSGVTFAVGGQNQSFSGTLFVSSANDKTPVSLSVQNPGYDTGGYSSPTFTSQLKLASGAWADCGNITVTATTGYRLASFNVTNGGSGYTSTPTIAVTGGVGTTSNPTGTVTRGFPVTGLTVTSGGNGYPSPPTVTLTGGGGSGATATASVTTSSTTTYPVASITITSGGGGYTSAPAVALTGGGGTGAAATAAITSTTLTTYPIASIAVTSGGSGYDLLVPPTVTLTGGGGSGATATATVSSMNTGLFFVDHINVDTNGSGYTSNPTVTLSGGGGTGAAATAVVSGGTKYGKVWLLTSLAETRSGARSMVQAEVASAVLGFATGGALTLDGPNPIIDAMPNSVNFYIRGNDANSCGDPVTEEDHPAIDGFDDPNANPPTNSVETIIDSLPRPDHYTGAGGTPSVQNGYGALGETMTTPAGMDSVMSAIYNMPQTKRYTSANVGTFNPAATTLTSMTYVDGDLTLNGNGHGYGILVVTGTLTMSGNFSWDGIIFVVGDGNVQMNGGGNGQINGSLWVSKTWDSSHNLLSEMGSPTFGWNGGGGNGMQYDHCKVSNLMSAVPLTNLTSTRPLKVLSYRSLPY